MEQIQLGLRAWVQQRATRELPPTGTSPLSHKSPVVQGYTCAAISRPLAVLWLRVGWEWKPITTELGREQSEARKHQCWPGKEKQTSADWRLDGSLVRSLYCRVSGPRPWSSKAGRGRGHEHPRKVGGGRTLEGVDSMAQSGQGEEGLASLWSCD